ncbi:pesticin C-terminus-like muramidase, partial [Crocosphaera sp. XPORK-15E]|uniref:pesticin C-terminus-like muramidase n=1 Tax=Crocosphaera sp. XPORK-15E TaxID=3110247 RepID=UPI002B20EA02
NGSFSPDSNGYDRGKFADVNGDGRQDYVVVWNNGGKRAIATFLANPDGTFNELIGRTMQNGSFSPDSNGYDRGKFADINGDGMQDYVYVWNNNGKRAFATYLATKDLDTLRNQYYPALNDATTLYNLQQEITDELTNSQTQLETLKAQISQKQAASVASLSQAKWYEEQAQINWDLSRKAGPTWTEWRSYKSGGFWGSKTKWVAVVHVDHNWIIWDAYTKQATSLRQYAANLDQEVIEDTHQQDLTDQLIDQWQQANLAADEAELALDQFIAQLELLEAQRQLLPEQQAQLDTFSALLPTLKEQLAIAEQAAEDAKANTIKEQAEYDTSSQAYQTALNDVLAKKATLDTNTQNLLQQIANTRAWVEQQTLSLDTEITETIALEKQLKTQLDAIALLTSTPETQTKQVQLQQSVDLLTHKEIILTAQKAALTQKITLLNAQKTVVETEHQLLLATIDSPDNDYSNLEDQLLDAQKALAEVQKLAEQAEATSIALTASMEDLQAFLEVQNDQYLTEIQAKQQTLQDLLAAIELKENYTLLGIEKQLELNTLETQLQTRLIEATEAGSQEAAYLLTVAQQNNFATAAEIYYTDYRDLMTDTGGGCAGGIARPDDAVKADYYYNEMLKYRALQDQAQQQADQFAIVKEAAEEQIDLIKQQTAIAQLEFNEIQSSINNTQQDIETLQQQLNIAELRIDALEYLRNWTEQTLVQLLQVEQLNLAQATLEQQFAQQRQLGIDETITAQFEKQRADINRDRAIATAKLEQLNQLQAEDALQQALNDLRSDLGLQPIDDIIQQAEYKGQLAGILSDLETIQSQPELPENIQTILAETTADIHDALQGKEAVTIQDNLLKSATALIEEANQLQTEIAKLDAEEAKYTGLLNQSETDLQGATKALYDEIIISQELGEETEEINQEYLEVLYKIGYAQGAVDLSSELAKQSKDILNQIIDGRIQERKARKKAAFNEIFGTITTVLAVAGVLFTGGATLGLYSATSTLATLGTNLTLASGALSAVQSAYNGDWTGAIFSLAMTVVSYQISNIKAELSQAADLVDIADKANDIDALWEATIALSDLEDALLPTLKNLQTFQAAAQGAYNTYRAIDSGDGTLAFLSAIQGVANVVAIDGVNIGETLDKSVNFSNFEKALITAGQVSVATYQAIEAIETGNLLSGFDSITKIAGTIGTNFATELTQDNISNDWLTLKWIVVAGEVSVDGYKLIEAIEDGEWIDALKSIPKIAKGIKNSQENLEKKASKENDNNSSDSSTPPDNNQSSETEDSNIFDTIQDTFEQLTNKFEEYQDQLETYIKDKFGLDFDDLEKIGETVEIGQNIYEDPSVKGWLKGIEETLKLWDEELNTVIGKDATLNVNTLKNINSTVGVLYGANQQGGLNAWLSSVKDVFGIWQDDLKNWVYKNFYDPQITELAKQFNISPADIEVNDNGNIYYLGDNQLKILIGVKQTQVTLQTPLQISQEAKLEVNQLEQLSLVDMADYLDDLPDSLKSEVINYLQQKYVDPQSWLDAHPILIADNSGNLPIDTIDAQNKLKTTIFTEQYRINWQFISDLEGGRKLQAYIPKQNDQVIDKSGVTIATGFDLGSHSEAELKKLGFSTELIDKFKPFLGIKGEAANTKLQEYIAQGNTLVITEEEAKSIDILKKVSMIEQLETKYNNASFGVKFKELSESAQTAIASVAFQYGINGAPTFQNYATQQDWQNVVQELHKFGDKYPTRRRKEAYQLAESIYDIKHGFTVQKSYDIETFDPLTKIGKIDILTGGDQKADLLILGNHKGSFYKNNDPINGINDYAQIKNFDLKEDKLQLYGKATDYVLGSTEQGLGIYVKTSGQNELISILKGINSNNFDLNTNAIYVGQ